jgi:hypothetical protein
MKAGARLPEQCRVRAAAQHEFPRWGDKLNTDGSIVTPHRPAIPHQNVPIAQKQPDAIRDRGCVDESVEAGTSV